MTTPMSDAEPLLKTQPPPAAGVFTVPSKRWNTTNLEFVHMIADKQIKEFPKKPHTDPRRFPVPIEQVPDLTDFVYGDMPQALTLRPIEETGCCSCDRRYDVARDLFAEPVAEVKVALPMALPLFLCGCAGADVTMEPKPGQQGASYKGTLKRPFLPSLFANETKLEWEMANKPSMAYRLPAQCDCVKLLMCQTVWAGWRGSSDAVPQTQALYDSSLILRCSDACFMCKTHCGACKNACCHALDYAPRWTRPEDVRRLVATKYDYEFAFRTLDEEPTFEIAEGEVGEINRLLVRQPAHKVDALYTGRLYMDVTCGKPYVRFANGPERSTPLQAAVDARYRGSVDHANPSEDDHLIVLAGLIMHAMWTFPNKAKAPYRWGPADMFKGRLLPRAGGAMGSNSAV